VVAIGANAFAAADDWPQWRGPRRDGISRERGWLVGWSENAPPRVAWRASLGKGHSAVSVAGGRAYCLGWDGQQDTVYCFDAATGAVHWKDSYACEGILQWPGPRATPTIAGSSVYTLGQHGQLRAYDAASGKLRWAVVLPADYKPDVDYGFAWSPLVIGEKLILGVGRRGLAVATRDGSFAWGDDGQHGACVSPVPYEHGGRRGVIIVTTQPGRQSLSLVGVDPHDGTEQWRFDGWPEFWGAACVDPVFRGGRLFFSTSEQHRRCARFSIDGHTLREDWSHGELTCYTGGCVLLGDDLYAVSHRGILKCLDWNTGAVRWQRRGFDERGTLMAADGMLLIQTGASGELVIVQADPASYRELRRFQVFEGPGETYTVPVLANGRIYCRNYEGELVCLDVSRARQ
jgi:outer membrane protein assembly factor BamB